MPSAPALPAHIEQFPALRDVGVRHGFVGRVEGIDVDADRALALERLKIAHDEARRALGLGDMPFITAEQVHGKAVAVIGEGEPQRESPVPGVDGLLTQHRGLCLGIYVADCGPIYLVDPKQRAIGLVHSGRKGTELGIVKVAIETMIQCFGSQPGDLIVQLGPCIRPPHYEVDFAAQIVADCRALGVGRVEDCGVCTAADPARYYSYRREKGRTGRLLALLALE
jgi:copper oxidase (laccase) domain-containing protein